MNGDCQFSIFFAAFFSGGAKSVAAHGQGRIFVLELPYNSIRGLGYFLRLFFAFACNAVRIFLSFLVRVFLQSLSYEVEVPLRLANRQIFRINLKNPPAARALAQNANGGCQNLRKVFLFARWHF